MGNHRWLGGAIVSVALATGGCAVDLTVPSGAVIQCDSNDDCPQPMVCRETVGYCVALNQDTEPPGVVPDSISLNRDVGGPGAELIVSFAVTETLAQDPEVRLGSPNREPFGLLSQETLRYTFHRVLDGTESEAAWPLLVDLVDAAGNPALANALAFVRIDATPPAALAATVDYRADPVDPLIQPHAARDGSIIRVVVTTSEVVAAAPEPELWVRCGGAAEFPLSFATAESGLTNLAFADALTPAMGAEGTCTPVLTLADLAGNLGDEVDTTDPDGQIDLQAELGLTIAIDRTAPVAASTMDVSGVKHLRVPWGSRQTDGQAGHFVVVRDLLSSESYDLYPLPPATFGADGDAIVQGRVYDRAVGGGIWAVIGPAATTDGWAPAAIAAGDLSQLWLSALDAAGNESDRVAIDWIEWIGSTAGNLSPNNPTRAITTGQTHSALDPGVIDGITRHDKTTDPALTELDGVLITVETGPIWQTQPGGARAPADATSSGAPRLVFDESRRLLLMAQPPGITLQTMATWSPDNGFVLGVDSPDAPPDGASLVYDGLRDRVMAYGGLVSFAPLPITTDEHWEWTGEQWAKLPPPAAGAGPGARWGAHLIFDEGRGRVVLWGGITVVSDPADCTGVVSPEFEGQYMCFAADLWEWDGTTWYLADDGGGVVPPPRVVGTMAYSPDHGVMLFGGEDDLYQPLDDSWAWDGQQWTPLPETRSPPGRWDAALTFDPYRGGMVLHGGQTILTSPCPTGAAEQNGWCVFEDAWLYKDDDWSLLSLTGDLPGQRHHHFLRYVDELEGLMLADLSAMQADEPFPVWILRGAEWTRWLRPFGFWGQALAFNEATGRLVMFGGAKNVQDEILPDQACANLTGGGPYHYFESQQCNLDHTWTWDGRDWRLLPSSAFRPHPRSGHAMVYDPIRDRVVLFGGCWRAETYASCEYLVDRTGETPDYVWQADDTWEWNGTVWQDRTPVVGSQPGVRVRATMGFDGQSNEVLLFGGTDDVQMASAFYDDLWSWDGTRWLSIPQTGDWPPARSDGAMTYDPVADRVILFGGEHEVTGDNCDELCPVDSVLVSISGAGSCTAVCLLKDTWAWKQGSWTRLVSSPPPPPRMRPVLFYDASAARVTMVGGYSSARLELCSCTGLQSGWCLDGWWLDNEQWRPIDATDCREPLSAGGYTVGVYAATPRSVELMSTDLEQSDLFHSSLGLWDLTAPAVQLCFDFAASGISRDQVTSLLVSAYAVGATAPFDGTTDGAALYQWAWGSPIAGGEGPPVGSRWLRVAENQAGFGSGDPFLEWAPATAEEAQRVLSATGSLTLQVRPVSPAEPDLQGQLPAVGLDYAEVRVTYQP